MQLQSSKKQIILVSLLSLSAIAFPLASEAITVQEVPNPRKVSGGWVTDNANILSDSTEHQLDRMISDLEAKNGSEIAVVTVSNTKPSATPKAFATELFNYWGVGKKGKNNGVLLLISAGERRVQIETGAGIQSILPDPQTVSIIQTQIVPRFKQQDFNGGTLAGTTALVNVLQNPTANNQFQKQLPLAPAVPAQKVKPSQNDRSQNKPWVPEVPPQQIAPSPTPSKSIFSIIGVAAGSLLIIVLIGFLFLFAILWLMWWIISKIFRKLFVGQSPVPSYAGGVSNSRHNYDRNSNRGGFSSNSSEVSIDCSSNYSSSYSSSDDSSVLSGDDSSSNDDSSSDSGSSFGGSESWGGGGGADYSSNDCSSSSSDSGSSFGGGESWGGGGGADYSSNDCSSSSSNDSGSSFGGGESWGSGGGADYSSSSSSDYSSSSSDSGGGGGDW